MKKAITIILTLFTLNSFSQVNVGFIGGYTYQANSITAGLNIGGDINHLHIETAPFCNINRRSYEPAIIPLNIGYNILKWRLTPFASISYQTIGREEEAYFKNTAYEFKNGFYPGGGISYTFSNSPVKITLSQYGKKSNVGVDVYYKF